MRDRLNEAWQNARKDFVRLLLDAESRPALVLNVLAHISLIAVVWFLFWTLYAN
jgi:hypothetical protein